MDDFLSPEDLEIIKEILESPILPIPARNDEYGDNEFHRCVHKQVQIHNTPRSPIRSGIKSKKCAKIFIGGTDILPGWTENVLNPHFCTNLQCLKCDHIVLRFPDSQWDKSTDYLFLRNNYPNTVSKKLIKSFGYCAFCCQCTHIDTNQVQGLSGFETNWVCRGH